LCPEPIQSRCAVLRYSKLTDAQILSRLLSVCKEETVSYSNDGLEAVIFTAQGDLRQVITSIILLNICICIYIVSTLDMGCGGVGVCSVPCDRKVAGSNVPQALRSDLGQVAHP